MKKNIVIILSLLVILMLQGCSAPTSDSLFDFIDQGASAPPPSAPAPMENASLYSDYVYEVEAPMYDDADIGDGYGGASSLPQGVAQGVEARKVVTSAEFRILTEDFNGAMRRLEQKIAVSGSYLQQSESRAATEYRAAYASMTIRIPTALYGDFKNFLTDLAELDSASEHGEDVTVQYYDTEARLKVLQAQEERIKTFIAESKDLDEIFKIERELTRISTEIEQLTTVKNRLDNLSAYATVYVEINEIREDITVEPESFAKKVYNAFSGSIGGVVVAAQAFVLLLVWIWPLLVVAVIIFLILRRSSKRRAKTAKHIPPPPEEQKKEE